MTPFSRSLRSIQTDGFTGTALALAAALLLLGAWVTYTIAVPIPVSITIPFQKLAISRSPQGGTIASGFAERTRLKSGQRVRIINGSTSYYAEVATAIFNPAQNGTHVALVLKDAPTPASLTFAAPSQIVVETERLTPVILLMQSVYARARQ